VVLGVFLDFLPFRPSSDHWDEVLTLFLRRLSRLCERPLHRKWACGRKEVMVLAILGSGSSGNAALLQGPRGALLIDAGLSARQIKQRLEPLGVEAARLDGVWITHEHGDHTRGLDVLLRGEAAQVPIYANAHTRELLQRSMVHPKLWRVVQTGAITDCGGFRIESFDVPHDAVEPMGFVIECLATGARLGFLTDLGHVPAALAPRLRELDALYLESNYCPQMLAMDAKRPHGTKQRISGRHGHLSNDQAAELACSIVTPRLKTLILGHLSRDCNTMQAARGVMSQALARAGHGHTVVLCATPDEIAGPYDIRPPSRPGVEMAEIGALLTQPVG
jgi:phosphoribosyl 1,2-cyclic phosphodiesterase